MTMDEKQPRVTLAAQVSAYIAGMERARVTKTPEQRRTRILATTDTAPWKYDLALKLGYQPECWTGMWMLTPDPFQIIGKYVVITEMVAPFKKRIKLRPMPA